jgi:hypothetical protein
LLPSSAGVFAQIVAKSAVPRGLAALPEFALTEKRKPWTSPSDGRTRDGPWVA